jgi:hypothetical protein
MPMRAVLGARDKGLGATGKPGEHRPFTRLLVRVYGRELVHIQESSTSHVAHAVPNQRGARRPGRQSKPFDAHLVVRRLNQQLLDGTPSVERPQGLFLGQVPHGYIIA